MFMVSVMVMVSVRVNVMVKVRLYKVTRDRTVTG